MSDLSLLLTRRITTGKKRDFLTLPLSAEQRTRLRGRRITSCGCEVLLQLPREGCLVPGDVLAGEESSTQVLVEAALENQLVVRAMSPLDLIKAAYHLGNRHVDLEIHDDQLFLLEDHVLIAMLQKMGLIVEKRQRPFFPETGAYREKYSDHN